MAKIEKGTYEQIARKMDDGRCVLFLGAGASYGDSDRHEKGIPTATELARELSEILKKEYSFKISKDAGLPKIAQWVEVLAGREHLEDYLKKKIDSTQRPLKIHKIITQIPIRLILTTNYDRLLENQFDEDNKTLDYKVVVDDEELIKYWNDQKVMIIKIHGSIERGSTKKIVITEDDYIDFISQESLIKHTLRSIMATKTILFIGYSLADYNVRVLLKQIPPQKAARGAPHYLIQNRKVGQQEFSYWKQKGIEAYKINGTEFIEKLLEYYKKVGKT